VSSAIPIVPSAAHLTPGARLRAELERLRVDQVQLAAKLDVSRQTINNIVNDRQLISRSMALKLAPLTGRSSDYWLKAQFSASDLDPGPFNAADEAGPASNVYRADFSRGVAVLVNHQIIQAVRQQVIRIEPFKAKNVQAASIDFTLDDFIITADGKQEDVSDGLDYTLHGGQAVTVRTRECIWLPNNFVARVGAMTKIARHGIITSHGFQVDPGFEGHLVFCMFNAGGAPFNLKSGDPVISLEFMPLAAIPSS
jgi:deoxycytidine triphosphate deaminase/addiction module HigA family antidote